MRIAHLCLSNFYVDGFGYQENDLVRTHVEMGHEVLVLASTESIGEGGKLTYLPPSTYEGPDGAMVERIPYVSWLPHKLACKLRIHPGVYDRLSAFRPDTILFHGTCGWEVRTAAKYVSENPSVSLFIDSHEDWNNSARTFLSRELLHRRFYGPVLRSAVDKAEMVLCLSTEAIDFVHDLYRIDRQKLEFYPLGGVPLDGRRYQELRMSKRAELGLADNILIVQSGKQTIRKKLIESLKAFAATPNRKLRLAIAGVLSDEIREEAMALISQDDRVQFLGWQSREDLDTLLCAADVYLQPGTQSATMQHSLCNQCVVILDDCPAHQIYKADNGFFVSTPSELAEAIAALPTADLATMKENSLAFAKRHLDYTVLAQRILPQI